MVVEEDEKDRLQRLCKVGTVKKYYVDEEFRNPKWKEVAMKFPLTDVPVWPVVFGFVGWLINPWILVIYVPVYLLGVVWALWIIYRFNTRYAWKIHSTEIVATAAWSWLARLVIFWRMNF